MFQIKTQANADVYLDHNNVKIHTKTLTMVILNLRSIRSKHNLWMDYEVSIVYNNESITTRDSYIRPHKGNLGIISDIDDTFFSFAHIESSKNYMFYCLK
jgi:hypothetical protein